MENEIRKIIEATLSSNVGTCIKMQALCNLYDYLISTKEKMGLHDSSNYDNKNSRLKARYVVLVVGGGDSDI